MVISGPVADYLPGVAGSEFMRDGGVADGLVVAGLGSRRPRNRLRDPPPPRRLATLRAQWADLEVVMPRCPIWNLTTSRSTDRDDVLGHQAVAGEAEAVRVGGAQDVAV
ncbi:hypothetical protein Prum_030750 [Phytohabitans rumicis]|uniref:Uncharacterized protein n=1 Tax=Phytohabitans rumicis TaxID=1076125 RepID=A0A6V8KWH2_9ACTN|nr:hypothetical protein Prum_030750 [Phytohabitans rumicis]